MQLDAQFSADVQMTPNGTSFTTTNMTIGATANLLVIVLSAGGGSFDPSSVAVHWDSTGTNQAMTRTVSESAGSSAGVGTGAYIFTLLNPTTGNKTCAVTFGSSVSGLLYGYSFIGANTTGGATSFPNTAVNTGASTGPTVTCTSSTTSDFVVCCLSTGGSATVNSLTQTAGYRDRISAAGTAGASSYATNSSSVTFTAVLSASATWYMASLDIASGAPTLQGAQVLRLM